MLQKLTLRILAVKLLCFLSIHGNELALEDMKSIKISLLPEAEEPLLDAKKPLLRYGFHRIHDCQNFEKAFICVRKCLDLGYQIAHADQNCICTCYKNSVIAQYKVPVGSTKWKLGAPTTSVPSWAGGNVEKRPNDYEINANYTEFNEELTPDATADSDAVTEERVTEGTVTSGNGTDETATAGDTSTLGIGGIETGDAGTPDSGTTPGVTAAST